MKQIVLVGNLKFIFKILEQAYDAKIRDDIKVLLVKKDDLKKYLKNNIHIISDFENSEDVYKILNENFHNVQSWTAISWDPKLDDFRISIENRSFPKTEVHIITTELFNNKPTYLPDWVILHELEMNDSQKLEETIPVANLILAITLAVNSSQRDGKTLLKKKPSLPTTTTNCPCVTPFMYSTMKKTQNYCYVDDCIEVQSKGHINSYRVSKYGFSGWDYVGNECKSSMLVLDPLPFKIKGKQTCTIFRDSSNDLIPGVSDGCKILCANTFNGSLLNVPYNYRFNDNPNPCPTNYECFNPLKIDKNK